MVENPLLMKKDEVTMPSLCAKPPGDPRHVHPNNLKYSRPFTTSYTEAIIR